MNDSLSVKNKRLVLFLDGTWNNETSNTNVHQLKSLCTEIDVNQIQQKIYYHTGLGADLEYKFFDKILGGIIGYGIDKHVLDAMNG